MKNETPQHQDKLDLPVARLATEPKQDESSGEYSLSFYVSHPGIGIERDSMPLSALVHLQQLADPRPALPQTPLLDRCCSAARGRWTPARLNRARPRCWPAGASQQLTL